MNYHEQSEQNLVTALKLGIITFAQFLDKYRRITEPISDEEFENKVAELIKKGELV